MDKLIAIFVILFFVSVTSANQLDLKQRLDALQILRQKTSKETSGAIDNPSQKETRDVESDIDAIMATIDQILTEVHNLWQETDEIRGDIEETRKPLPMFYGKMSFKDTAAKEIYKYDTIVTNVGGGYNSADGKYRCPISGWYAVSIGVFGHYLKKETRYTSSAYLMKDSSEITYATTSSYISLDDDSWLNLHASNTAVFYCATGQKLWLQAFDTNSNRVNQASLAIHLLHKDYN